MTLDERFEKSIVQNKGFIENEICGALKYDKVCPECEGVPCDECMKYAVKVLANIYT